MEKDKSRKTKLKRQIANDSQISRCSVSASLEELGSIRGKKLREQQMSSSLNENDLIHKINTVFSADDRQRYNELYAKFQKENITEKEKKELLELSDKFEILNAKRLEYIGELAAIRNESFQKTINDLGIKSNKQNKSRPKAKDYEDSRTTP